MFLCLRAVLSLLLKTLVMFPQEKVGIRNSSHMKSILGFLSSKLSSQQGNGLIIEPKVTLSVEGNISAGKSTFLKVLEHTGVMQDMLQVGVTCVMTCDLVHYGHAHIIMPNFATVRCLFFFEGRHRHVGKWAMSMCSPLTSLRFTSCMGLCRNTEPPHLLA